MSEQEFEWIEESGPFGGSARCYVPAEYHGDCAMAYSSKGQERWAIFPSREIAINAAAGACRRDVGGYSNVSVYPVGATGASEAALYDGAVDWLFDGMLEDAPTEPGVAGIVRNFMQQLARRIAAEPHELLLVEWRDLERLLSEVFEGLGYLVVLTRPIKDGGFDLRLETDGNVYFVEVKHWSEPSKVGRGIVNRFTETVIANGGRGLLLSTSGFTSDVIQRRMAVTTYPVMLGDKMKILSLCRFYAKTETGVWVRERSPGELLFSDAF